MGKEAHFMAIRYKVDIMAELKKKGYSSTKIREEKLIGQSYLQQIRHGELVSWKTIDTICSLLECQPGDLREFVKEDGVQERGYSITWTKSACFRRSSARSSLLQKCAGNHLFFWTDGRGHIP